MSKSAKSVSKIVKPLRGGQITIPAEFRQKLGIEEDTLLRITLEDDELRLQKVEVTETYKGSPWLKELYQLFAPIREDLSEYAEEEIDSAIEQAVRGVRKDKNA